VRWGREQHHIDGVFVLLLFGVFACCILLVLLTGAGAYQRLTERDAASYERRTAVQYVAGKVRHADTAGGVFVGDFDGTPDSDGDTLFLSEQVDGATYYTRIYWYDGAIRELYTDAEGQYAPEDGDEVLSARSLSFSQSGSLLTIGATDDGGTRSTLALSLRSGGEAEP